MPKSVVMQTDCVIAELHELQQRRRVALMAEQVCTLLLSGSLPAVTA